MFICMQTINFITHSFLKTLQRNRKGGIQLLRLHLGGGQGASIYNNMQIGKGRGCKLLKSLFRPSKRKRNTEMGRNCG